MPSKYSGDLVEIGVAKEAVRGTIVAPAYGWKWEGLSVVDKTTMSMDEGRRGRIEDSLNSYVAGQQAEGDLEGPVRDQLIGLILLSLLGTAADSTVETGVYDHVITVAQNNTHPSLTINKREPNAAFDHAMAMIDSFELTCVPDEINRFKAGFNSKSRVATAATIGTFAVTIATPGVVTLAAHGLQTGDVVTLATTIALPTGLVAGTQYYVVKIDATTFSLATTLANALANTRITTSGSQSGVHTLSLVFRYSQYQTENIFIGGKHTTLKLASAQSGLSGASAINVRSAKLKVNTNVKPDRTIGQLAPADFNNGNFDIELEVEVVVTDSTHFTTLLAGTSQAVRLDMNNTDVTIGLASNPRVMIDLYKCNLQDATPKYERGELTLQTLQFKAHLSETDMAMIAVTVRNTVASY